MFPAARALRHGRGRRDAARARPAGDRDEAAAAGGSRQPPVHARGVRATSSGSRTLCARHGVSLLAAALQYVVRPPVVAATVPGARRPEQATANADAMREPIPDAFWRELEPLIGNFSIALPPPA